MSPLNKRELIRIQFMNCINVDSDNRYTSIASLSPHLFFFLIWGSSMVGCSFSWDAPLFPQVAYAPSSEPLNFSVRSDIYFPLVWPEVETTLNQNVDRVAAWYMATPLHTGSCARPEYTSKYLLSVQVCLSV